jgi:hypothetical protein
MPPATITPGPAIIERGNLLKTAKPEKPIGF